MFNELMSMILNNETALFLEELEYAVEYDNINDIFIRDSSSLLNTAIHRNNIEIFNALLAEGANVNAHPYEGDFPISVAVHANNLEMAKRLVALGADVNLQTDRAPLSGSTALYTAMLVREDNVRMIDFLLENGADLTPVLNHFCTQTDEPKLMVLIERCHVLGIDMPQNYQHHPVILQIQKELSEKREQEIQDMENFFTQSNDHISDITRKYLY